jgi:hypothetical protein
MRIDLARLAGMGDQTIPPPRARCAKTIELTATWKTADSLFRAGSHRGARFEPAEENAETIRNGCGPD